MLSSFACFHGSEADHWGQGLLIGKSGRSDFLSLAYD
jgi:hypothetical protein